MVTDNYLELRDLAKTHVCGECGGELVLYWSQERGCYRVKCGNDAAHKGFQQALSFTKAHRQGIDVPPEIKAQIERRQEAMENKAVGFTIPEQTDRGTGTHLSVEQSRALITWASNLGLRAELGHVCVMYGQPYPTVDGLVYHAKSKDPDMRYRLYYYLAHEREELGLKEGDFAVKCQVLNKDGEVIAERIGVVRVEELTEESTKTPGQLRYPIVAKKPLEMAENRAMWDAFSDACPLGLEQETHEHPGD